jgi:hypothetical protein
MPRRTVTVTHLWATTRYRTEDRRDLTALPGGGDLLHLARALFAVLPKDDLVDHDKERYVSIEAVQPLGRTLLLELQAGAFGAAGQTRNVNTHATEHEFNAAGAATARLRALLVVPQRSRSALLFIEHAGLGAGGGALIKPLLRFLRHRHRELTFHTETVVENSAWLEGARLNEVTGVVYGHSPNLEDRIQGLPLAIGRIDHTIRPTRGGFLPRPLYDRLAESKINRADLFGIREDEEVSDVFVTMTNHGRRKTFALGSQGYPAVRYLLSDTGETEPATERFRAFCLDLAPDLFEAVGADWEHASSYGEWPPEVLGVAVEVPPR